MNQPEIDRAVARATGETITLIKSLGFSLLHMPPPPACRARAQRMYGRRRRPAPARTSA